MKYYKIVRSKIRTSRYKLHVPLPKDAGGFIQRECPNCGNLFKISQDCISNSMLYCPYCISKNAFSSYTTNGQIAHSQKIIRESFLAKKNEVSFGRISVINPRIADPLLPDQYCEKDLDTPIQCSYCKGSYIIYGINSVCPFCGKYNGLDFFEARLKAYYDQIQLQSTTNDDLEMYCLPNPNAIILTQTLKSIIDSFESYFKDLEIYGQKMGYLPRINKKIVIQNLSVSKDNIIKYYNIDISIPFSDDEWTRAERMFMRRHLYTHKEGVVDENYLERTNDTSAELGHVMPISKSDIDYLIEFLRKLAQYLSKMILSNDSGEKNDT